MTRHVYDEREAGNGEGSEDSGGVKDIAEAAAEDNLGAIESSSSSSSSSSFTRKRGRWDKSNEDEVSRTKRPRSQNIIYK